MSLDVYLIIPGMGPEGTGLYVRDGDQIREVLWDEWHAKFPGAQPVCFSQSASYVYERNISHNLGKMAEKAGIYQALWRPDEMNVLTARQLIEPLRAGLAKLKADPVYYSQFNPENGWGDYAGLLDMVEEYLKACELYPYALVKVSR
jgi:hypothetical protein